MKTIRLIFIGICISAMAFADNTPDKSDFSIWDTNNDNLISRSEFVKHFTAYYSKDWNVVGNEYTDEEDYFVVTFRMWDVDNDNRLNEEEWLHGYDFYYGDYILDNYSSIDTDKDGFISYKEYFKILSPTNYYVAWDVNGDKRLSEFELARLVFNLWDLSNNNFIEKDEYNDLYSYYLKVNK